MNSFLRTTFFPIAIVIFAFGGTLLAQTPRPTPPPDDDTGQLKTFEVRLPVTVTLKKDLITSLGRGDFAVFEDGVQQEITFFTDQKSNPPVYVGVLDGHLAVHGWQTGIFKRGGGQFHSHCDATA